ncbi:acetyl-CoA synthetase-like protein [Athelia psychrophila]|uniref:Acetyl-CoA synthetase-like protein n=1 Tax=Athelia psychrophila TaxID=1759441 RepID=A0A166HU76_9AGAM|nr:acetyl-CoA synthetase-like protein [Fibularhizoctonia sp. CBS 109695]
MPTQPSAVYPPLDGSVLLPSLADFNLQHNASLPAFVYSEAVGSLTEISFLEFGRAAHRAAHLLRPEHGGSKGEVVAIIIDVDKLLYAAIFAGLMRAELVPFPISPRNSAEAVAEMLQKSGCHRVLSSHASLGVIVAQIAALVPPEHSLSIQEVPTLAQCYPALGHETASDAFTPYPAPSVPPEKDEVVLILHSSGSTGHPKPIPHTNRAILGWCALESVVNVRRTSRISEMHFSFPLISGLRYNFIIPMSSLTSASLYPPTSFYDHAMPPVMPTSDSIIEHCKRTGVTGVFTMMGFLATWASEPETVKWLTTMDFLAFSGGPLAVKTGDALSHAGVKLVNLYGSTEIGSVTKFSKNDTERSPEDWNYVRFSDKVNIRWAPQADGSFESQFLDTEVHRVSVHNLPDAKGYATNDCWVPHPTKSNFWRFVGRLDDVIILASGQKVVPAILENVIMSSPLVIGMVVFGHGRLQVGLLLEPAPGVVAGDLAGFRNRIWSVVEEANKSAPTFGRIFKEMILVTAADRPLERTGKETVAKKATMKAYADEIDALYDRLKEEERVSVLGGWAGTVV